MKTINLHSEFLNKSAIARALGLSPMNYHDKLRGRGSAKKFTHQELSKIEKVIIKDLFEKIPLENIDPNSY